MGRGNETGRDRDVMKTKRNRERERGSKGVVFYIYPFAHKNVYSRLPSFTTFLGVGICKIQAY